MWDALCELNSAPYSPRTSTSRTRARSAAGSLRDVDLRVTPSHMFIVLAVDPRCAWLRALLHAFNDAEVALPWLRGRRVMMGPPLGRNR